MRVSLFPAKLVPVGYGIRKLQINAVIEDDKVRLQLSAHGLACLTYQHLFEFYDVSVRFDILKN